MPISEYDLAVLALSKAEKKTYERLVREIDEDLRICQPQEILRHYMGVALVGTKGAVPVSPKICEALAGTYRKQRWVVFIPTSASAGLQYIELRRRWPKR